MELPQKAKDSFGEIFKLLLKDREDLTDQVEKLKFDSHVGRFVREFEHIKSDM